MATKIVDGREVTLTAQEEADFLATFDNSKKAAQKAAFENRRRYQIALDAYVMEEMIERAKRPNPPQAVKDWDDNRPGRP